MTAKATDPVVESIEALRDPARFTVFRNIPVFRESERWKSYPDGTRELLKVDAAQLERTASRTKQLQDEEDRPVVVTVGHRKLSAAAPETAQPPVVAYALDPRVGTFGRKKHRGILADFYVRNADVDEFKKHPFRSADFYGGLDEITGVALLTRDPELDLGFLTFSRDTSGCLQYSLEDSPVPDPTTPPSATAPDNDFAGKVHAAVADKYPKLGEMHEQYMKSCAPAQYGAAGGAPPGGPSPTSTATPALPPAVKKPDEAPAQYAREIQELRDGNAKLQRTVQYGRELQKLVTAGCQIDFDAELADSLDLTPTQFQRHLERLRRTGAPVGGPPIDLGGGPGLPAGGEKPMTREQKDAAVQYQSEKGCTWREAVAHAKGKQ